MTLAFLNLSTIEVIAILTILLLVIVAVGRYGRDTILGYGGSVLLSLLTTPLVAFIVISFIKPRKAV